MKILHISTLSTGGASKASLRLHQALLRKDIDSSMLFKNIESPNLLITNKKVHEFNIPLKVKLKNRAIYLLKKTNCYKSNKEIFLESRNPFLHYFSFPFSDLDITKNKLYKKADIINLHWVSHFIDYPTFFKKNKKPVVWRTPDMNPFTGGEHYTETITGIDDKGNPIKRVISDKEKEIFKKNINIKLKSLQNIKSLNIVCPSTWIAEEAKKSEVFNNFPIHHIPHGVNTENFKLYNKKFARDIFNIPQDKFCIMFVAAGINMPIKGLEFLNKAIKQINNKDIFFYTVGGYDHNKEDLNYHKLGNIHDEKLLGLAYSSADLFVSPSLMDVGPMTVIESLLCGTPVVAFPKGGALDMIKDGENGYLAKELSVNSLAETIIKFMQNQDNFDRIKISKLAEKKYNLSVHADNYIKLYMKILNN